MSEINQDIRQMWDELAPWWDKTIGEADACHRSVIHPAEWLAPERR